MTNFRSQAAGDDPDTAQPSLKPRGRGRSRRGADRFFQDKLELADSESCTEEPPPLEVKEVVYPASSQERSLRGVAHILARRTTTNVLKVYAGEGEDEDEDELKLELVGRRGWGNALGDVVVVGAERKQESLKTKLHRTKSCEEMQAVLEHACKAIPVATYLKATQGKSSFADLSKRPSEQAASNCQTVIQKSEENNEQEKRANLEPEAKIQNVISQGHNQAEKQIKKQLKGKRLRQISKTDETNYSKDSPRQQKQEVARKPGKEGVSKRQAKADKKKGGKNRKPHNQREKDYNFYGRFIEDQAELSDDHSSAGQSEQEEDSFLEDLIDDGEVDDGSRNARFAFCHQMQEDDLLCNVPYLKNYKANKDQHKKRSNRGSLLQAKQYCHQPKVKRVQGSEESELSSPAKQQIEDKKPKESQPGMQPKQWPGFQLGNRIMAAVRTERVKTTGCNSLLQLKPKKPKV